MDHIFINVQEPSDALQLAKKTSVRSHVARHQWKNHNASNKDQRTKERKKKREEYLPVRIELDCRVLHEHRYLPIPERSVDNDNDNAEGGHQNSKADVQTAISASPSISVPIGGLRVDPFRTYPVEWNPLLPSLVDHCKPRSLLSQ